MSWNLEDGSLTPAWSRFSTWPGFQTAANRFFGEDLGQCTATNLLWFQHNNLLPNNIMPGMCWWFCQLSLTHFLSFISFNTPPFPTYPSIPILFLHTLPPFALHPISLSHNFLPPFLLNSIFCLPSPLQTISSFHISFWSLPSTLFSFSLC